MRPVTSLKLLAAFAAMFSFAVLPALAQRGHPGGMPRGHGMAAPGGPEHANGGRENLPTMGGSKTPDQMLSHNSKLSSRMQSLLPPGTSVQAAAAGFRNLGQFVAAVHVAHNLGLPFSQLKGEMVGSRMSLGKAVHRLKPEANAKSEVKVGKKQAKEDLKH